MKPEGVQIDTEVDFCRSQETLIEIVRQRGLQGWRLAAFITGKDENAAIFQRDRAVYTDKQLDEATRHFP